MRFQIAARLLVLWTVGVVLVSLAPAQKLADAGAPGFLAIVAHFGMYSGMTVLLMESLRMPGARLGLLAIVSCVALTSGLGALMELAQGLTPTRHPSWEDAVVNTIGAATGAIASMVAQALLVRSRHNTPR